jgi:hypothetical protein
VTLLNWVCDRIIKARGDNLEAKVVAAGLARQGEAATFATHYIEASKTTIDGQHLTAMAAEVQMTDMPPVLVGTATHYYWLWHAFTPPITRRYLIRLGPTRRSYRSK